MSISHIQKKKERDPNRLWLDQGDFYLEIKGDQYEKVHDGEGIVRFCGPEELLGTKILALGEALEDGMEVKAPTIPWFEIARHMLQTPKFMFHFARKPRKFEEFVAGAYRRAGWDQVILTPSSSDKGRDVIAAISAKRGMCSLRVLDQAKAYTEGRLVRHDAVRAVVGVLNLDQNASKALITTTSDFEPHVLSKLEFSGVIPYRLELRNGQQLLTWLGEINHYANAQHQSDRTF
jgi:restriction system protein